METPKTTTEKNPAFELNTSSFLPTDHYRHVYNGNVICVTDSRGYEEPEGKSVNEIRLDAAGGFIPLWDKDVILYWRFNESFGSYFKDQEAAKVGIRKLFNDAMAAWQNACPVQLQEVTDGWDFEIAMHPDNCDAKGCVLASSFFPGTGQNTFFIYPKMFYQSAEEQQETIEHELGHIFGLRHFFANITETKWKSELFGSDNPFSIMNYGNESKLTDADRADLQRFYQAVWSGELKDINGTGFKKFVSFHMKG